METPAILISGATPSFQGPITINVYNGEGNNRSPAHQVRNCEECDYNRPIMRAKSADFYDHIKNAKEFYQITNYPKGRVLIVNNEFKGEDDERKGSNIDVFDMYHLWSKMGCGVTIETDLSASKLLERVEEFAAHQETSDFCVVIIMSHGKEDDLIVGSRRGTLEVSKVVKSITSSRSLVGKPKLIFFQICRGRNVQKTHVDAESFNTDDSSWINELLREVLPSGRILGSEQTDVDAEASQYASPVQDVMLAFGTQPECFSFREPKSGSWFIQSIRQVFADKSAKHDVVTLMNMVKEDLTKKKAYAPGTDYDEGVVTMDGSDSFGKKRLMLFPGFPKPQKE